MPHQEGQVHQIELKSYYFVVYSTLLLGNSISSKPGKGCLIIGSKNPHGTPLPNKAHKLLGHVPLMLPLHIFFDLDQHSIWMVKANVESHSRHIYENNNM